MGAVEGGVRTPTVSGGAVLQWWGGRGARGFRRHCFVGHQSHQLPTRNPAEAEKRHDAPWNVPELRAALDLERLVASKAAGLGEGARMCWGVLQGEERRA